MEFEAIVTHWDSPLWSLFIPVPDAVSKAYKKNGTKRLVCHLNGEVKCHRALLPKGDGTDFIMMNKELCKKLDVTTGDVIRVVLEPDESDYGMPLPEEFRELLDQDPEGDKYFHALTPGKQRSLLYIIGKPKGSDTRIRKGITVLEYLKASKGKLDFKELNVAFKNSRF